MDCYTSFTFSSNMILMKLNHTACSVLTQSRSSSDCLQCSLIKPKVLLRQMMDCVELSVCGSTSVNAVNLTSLLLMPIIPKVNMYLK